MIARPMSIRGGHAEVPEVVVMRLPQYIRILSSLLADGVEMVSSHQLGEVLQVTPAQIRKDLSYFGRFGKQGRGYSVENLLEELRDIMGLNRHWNVGLVGVGRLGRAILSYPGFAPEGFQIVAAFDADPSLVGQLVSDLKVRSMDELDQSVLDEEISIGIVAVPSPYAQGVIDRLTECGVKAILCYAPIAAQTQEGVKIRHIDPVLSLQTMTFYLSTDEPAPQA